MATNGKVQTNTAYDSYFWVEWEQVGDQDIANNRTQIKWSCGLYTTHKFYLNAIKMSAFSINGIQVYGGGTYSNFTSGGKQEIASGYIWISHNADGSKTFSISSFTAWLYANYNYSSSGGNFSLTQIPREATLTYASDFTDTQNPSIRFNNPAGYKFHYVWIEPNPSGEHLCRRYDIPNTGSYTWSLTPEERDILRNCCRGPSCTVRIGMYYYVGSEIKHHFLDRTFRVEESDLTRPTVNMVVELNNDLLPAKFAGMYIQGKSKVNVSASAEGKFSADIVSYWANVDGKGYLYLPFTSDVIQSSGVVDITVGVKDSREFIGNDIKKINVIPYSKPLVIPLGSENSILCYRSDGNGKRVGNSTSVWVKARRFYYDLSKANTCTLQYRVKPVNDEWNDSVNKWEDLIPSTGTVDGYDALIPGVVFALKDSYTLQLRAIDDIGEFDIKTFEIPTQDVALHLGKGGKKVSVGTYCTDLEDYTFYSEWKSIFDKDVVVGGDIIIGQKSLKDYILNVINGGG